MTTEEITIRVDAKTAAAYREASEQDRLKMEILMSMGLQDALQSRLTLKEIMSEISREAQSRGMTPEILEDILNGK